ncbi:MAG: hypothetical protein MK179_23195, partial [Pirellulaceae bacterium]|nr:hypothetical protein [Pirellulaceae bacterium]
MGSIITSPQPVFLSSPVTVARIEFDNENTYSLMGNGGLSLGTGMRSNAGIEVDRGSQEFITDVHLLTDVDLDLAFGSTLTFNGPLNLNGHTIRHLRPGDLRINSTQGETGSIIATRGPVSGFGVVPGDLDNVSAIVAPGPGIGQLSVSDNYQQGSAGILQLELGGAKNRAFDSLSVGKTASLAGTLQIMLNGLIPSRGDQFNIIHYGQRTGTFDHIDGLEIGTTKRLVPRYGSDSLTLFTTEIDFFTSSFGNWNNMENWSSGFLPDDMTSAVIDNGGIANILNTTTPVGSLDVVNGLVSIDQNGQLNVNGITFVGPGGAIDIQSQGLNTQSMITQDAMVDGNVSVNHGAQLLITNELNMGPNGNLFVNADSTIDVLQRLKNLDVSSSTLTNGRFHIAGTLAIPNAQIITNQADLILEDAGVIKDLQSEQNVLSTLKRNTPDGSLTLKNHTLAVQEYFINAGFLGIHQSTFVAAENFQQTSGTTQLDSGTIIADYVDIQGGLFTGNGVVIGGFHNASQLTPGVGGPGALNIYGTFSQSPTGHLEMDIGGFLSGTEHDQIVVNNGGAVLDGHLELQFLDDFRPQMG